MALQVWLPLNGDLHNQGLSRITTTGTPTWKTSGKIGVSALDLSSRISFTCPELNETKYFSVCFWGMIESNPDSTANWMDVFSLTDKSTSGTTGYFRFETGYGAAAQGGIHWHDNSTNAIVNGAYTYNTATEQNKWHHICVTISSDKICSYYDGVLKQTQTSNLGGGSLTGVGWIGESTTRGGIQDIRIYDHALSAKEVEEISKGLILHYKLNTAAGLTDLIDPNANWNIYNNHNNTNMPSTLVDTGEYYDGLKIKRGTYTPTANSLNSIKNSLGSHGVYNWRQTFKANTKYVFWIYYKPISDPDIRCGGTASNIGGWTEIPPIYVGNGWYKVGQKRDGSVTTDKTDNIFVSFKFPNAVVNEPIIIDWAAPHLIEGIDEIPPNNDFYKNVIYDSSGYQHNGEIFTPLIPFSETPRYICSTYFNGETSAIKVPYTDIASTDDIFTLNLWFKKDDLGSKNYETLFGGPSGFEMDTRAGSATALTLYMASTRGTIFTQFNFGEWYMITMVNNGTNELYYVNAELKKTIDKKPMPAGNYYIGAWSTETRQNYKGLISNFRIYKTALTEKQIKELYDTSATVDKNGNIYTREAIEL